MVELVVTRLNDVIKPLHIQVHHKAVVLQAMPAHTEFAYFDITRSVFGIYPSSNAHVLCKESGSSRQTNSKIRYWIQRVLNVYGLDGKRNRSNLKICLILNHNVKTVCLTKEKHNKWKVNRLGGCFCYRFARKNGIPITWNAFVKQQDQLSFGYESNRTNQYAQYVHEDSDTRISPQRSNYVMI